jgi:ATP-dependent exoDNAse (exonuclease V) beta subunit
MREPASVPEAVVFEEPLGEVLRRTQPMPRRRTPSGEESFRVKGTVLFSAGREPGRRLGTCVHELFAEIEWLRPWDEVQARWLERGLVSPEDLAEGAEGVEAEACLMVRRVLESEAGREIFAPAIREAEVWRERPFDLVMDGEWVSGVFDRVMVRRDGGGRVVSAWIVDFKTDEVPDEASLKAKREGYGPQIRLYRAALSKLTGLAQDKIRAVLIFTRLSQIVEL